MITLLLIAYAIISVLTYLWESRPSNILEINNIIKEELDHYEQWITHIFNFVVFYNMSLAILWPYTLSSEVIFFFRDYHKSKKKKS